MATQMQKVEDRVGMIDNVVIFGMDLLHSRQIDIISYALKKMPDNDLQALFILDHGLSGDVGEYCRATRSAAISLHEIMVQAMESSLKEDNGLSLPAQCWIGFIYTLFHELHHNVALSIARAENMTDEWKKDEEELAKEYASEMVEPCIIDLNAEVPVPDEFPLMDRLLMFMAEELKSNPDSTWAGVQKERIDEGIMFINQADIFDSLVSYMRETTETPEKYEGENPGAVVEIKQAEEMPNLFDQKILPGEQGDLFLPQREITTCTDVAEQAIANTGGDTGAVLAAMAAQVMDEDGDIGDEDDLPPEACADESSEALPGVTPSADPFAPQTTPPQIDTAASVEAVQQSDTIHAPVATGGRDILINFYTRCYQQMFTGGVLEPLHLTDAEKELNAIVTCMVSNPAGSGYIQGDVTQAGYVKGVLYLNGTLPAYDLYLNWGGVRRHMKLIAQNPAKQSKYGEMARNGAKIMWILDADKEGHDSFVAKIINGEYSPCGR